VLSASNDEIEAAFLTRQRRGLSPWLSWMTRSFPDEAPGRLVAAVRAPTRSSS